MGTVTSTEYIACPDCDGLFTTPEAQEGERVVCPRCSAHLWTRRSDTAAHGTALVIAAASFFILANVLPMLSLKADYRQSEMLLTGSVAGLENQGFPILAALVGTFVIAAPLLVMGAMLYVLIPLMCGRRWRWAFHLCHTMQEAKQWNMMEVYLLGVLVSLLKLGKLATLNLGLAFWAFVGFILCLASAITIIDPTELWRKLEEAHP